MGELAAKYAAEHPGMSEQEAETLNVNGSFTNANRPVAASGQDLGRERSERCQHARLCQAIPPFHGNHCAKGLTASITTKRLHHPRIILFQVQ